MKRKSNMMRECIGVVLAEGVLICGLCSCTPNIETVDFDNVNQNTKESIVQSQDSVDADGDRSPASANESSEQPMGSAEISSDQEQGSVNGSSEQLTGSAEISSEQAQAPANENAAQSDTVSHEGGTVSTVSPEERYKAILLDNANFISTDLQNQELNLTQIKKIITEDEIAVNAARFAMIDLDSDGQKEIVLWIQINGVSDYGFEILRYQNGDVYGYTLQYREFMNLKTDGTFLFSGGAADSGIGKVKFSGNEYTIDRQSYSESQYGSDNELNIQYFVNDESCSEEVFQEAMLRQEEKADIEWYDLSANSVNSVLK